MYHAHLLFAEIVYQAKTIRNHGHVKIELWLLLSCIGLDKCPNFPPSECTCILPFCFSPRSHLSACNSQFQNPLLSARSADSHSPICSPHSPLSKMKRREQMTWSSYSKLRNGWNANQMFIAWLEQRWGGKKLCSWGWERVRGGRDEEEEEVPLREKNSRQELALRGNKRQREDATVGVDGG